MNLSQKIKEIIQKIRCGLSYDCYTEMEQRGIASYGLCNGLAGGDKFSDYLQYECIDCPHFTNNIKN